MKFLKLFSVLALSMATMNIFAAIDAQATIIVEGDVTENGDQIDVYQDPSAEEYFADDQYASGVYGVNLYAVMNELNYSSVKLKKLSNVKVVFKANTYDTNYTMSFADVVGTITLANADTSFVIDASKTYSFTCEKSATIEFTVNPVYSYTREGLTKGNYATFCYPTKITEIEGGEAFEVWSYDSEKAEITIASVTTMEAGKPYVLKASATEAKFYWEGDSVATPEAGNGIYGSFEAMTLTKDEMFFLNSDNTIYKAGSNCTIAANRAYFKLDAIQNQAPAPGRKFITISLNGGAVTTGVENVEANTTLQKMMINGQLIILKDGKMFNAQGMQL